MMNKAQSLALERARAAYLDSPAMMPNGTVVTQLERITADLKEYNPELYALAQRDQAVAQFFAELIVVSSLHHSRESAAEEIASLQDRHPHLILVNTGDADLSEQEDVYLSEGMLSAVDQVNLRRAVVKQFERSK